MDGARDDQLLERAEAILAGRGHGFGVPILRHLALRGHAEAMLALAARTEAPGGASSVSSRAWLERRAHRLGARFAAQHAAVTRFNQGDLAGYRRWLHRAARAGDGDAAAELRRFEVRLPHEAARRLRRLRPTYRDEGWWRPNRVASGPTRHLPPDPFHPSGDG